MTDPYDTLGVPRTADAEAIKRAFRRLALENHPDHNDGDKAKEERFKEVSAANEVLSDPEKRARWDRLNPAQTNAYDINWDTFRAWAGRSAGVGCHALGLCGVCGRSCVYPNPACTCTCHAEPPPPSPHPLCSCDLSRVSRLCVCGCPLARHRPFHPHCCANCACRMFRDKPKPAAKPKPKAPKPDPPPSSPPYSVSVNGREVWSGQKRPRVGIWHPDGHYPAKNPKDAPCKCGHLRSRHYGNAERDWCRGDGSVDCACNVYRAEPEKPLVPWWTLTLCRVGAPLPNNKQFRAALRELRRRVDSGVRLGSKEWIRLPSGSTQMEYELLDTTQAALNEKRVDWQWFPSRSEDTNWHPPAAMREKMRRGTM